MYRIIIISVLHDVIVQQVGHLPKVILCMYILHIATNQTFTKDIRENPDEEISQIVEMKQQ